jgi:hypothetical protein
VLRQYLPLAFLVAFIFAMAWPVPGQAVLAPAVMGVHIVTFVNICTVFFISGLTLRTDELKAAFSRTAATGTLTALHPLEEIWQCLCTDWQWVAGWGGVGGWHGRPFGSVHPWQQLCQPAEFQQSHLHVGLWHVGMAFKAPCVATGRGQVSICSVRDTAAAAYTAAGWHAVQSCGSRPNVDMWRRK